jgi:Flp pilus assembly protein TadG
MKSNESKLIRRLFRRGESGQAIVILALAFIVLLGFVGIVTDVSLMFVRYNTLRRAVDAASVAAAGQVRKLAPNATELAAAGGNETVAEGYAFARNIANLSLAAREFIEFYGLSPTLVTVDMCATIPIVDRPTSELCTQEQRKLVRVTAQVASPTVFLRLFGWPTLTLEATAVSETAALDVIIIMDVSESMLEDTTYQQWQDIGQGRRYPPPRMSDLFNSSTYNPTWGTNPDGFWDYILGRTQAQLNTELSALTPASFPTSQTQPRAECRWRMEPNSLARQIPTPILTEFRSMYSTYATAGIWSSPGFYEGFVPSYNYFDCCNDPNGDWAFVDLICQPFGRARNATSAFLDRIDFARGDRVAFVTYDRFANLIDPDGTGTQTHMIDNAVNAQATLEQRLGVRAVDDFYADAMAPFNGQWDSMVIGGAPYDGTNSVSRGYFDGTTVGGLIQYPVRDSCILHNALLPDSYTLHTSPTGDGLMYQSTMHNPPWTDVYHSYERWASCRGGNIGAALREANNALTAPATTRTTGTVWVMVLLTDGASGASDPVRRSGSFPALPDPYPPGLPAPGGYGAYGFCPYGTQAQPRELVTDLQLPFCADEDPTSRHFCFDATVLGFFDLANPKYPSCENEYDVDDYARDWADFVALTTEAAGDAQLPTIFTIGFGIDFATAPGTCAANTMDCLGEEMLRYIADVGDNFRIDIDYQQDWADNDIRNYPGAGQPDYGPRGICEDPTGLPGEVKQLPPRQWCGNYYNAPTPTDLELVFDEIASRMFTRLAR